MDRLERLANAVEILRKQFNHGRFRGVVLAEVYNDGSGNVMWWSARTGKNNFLRLNGKEIAWLPTKTSGVYPEERNFDNLMTLIENREWEEGDLS